MAAREYPLQADGRLIRDDNGDVIAMCRDEDDADTLALKLNKHQANLKAKRLARQNGG